MTSSGPSALDRIRGFERGCDDYLDSDELSLHRAAGTHRRAAPPPAARLQHRAACASGTLEIDALARQAWVDGCRGAAGEQGVQPAAHARARAGARLQAGRADGDRLGVERRRRTAQRTRTLDSHASRLRRKLSVHGASYVINVWGVGYRLMDVPATAPADHVRLVA